ncbi:MAG: hypothetical protein KJO26_06090 [Deltaproteobacteria bacterium]|nr:hypothetical protein [Deltaproteobacteria bacterium]
MKPRTRHIAKTNTPFTKCKSAGTASLVSFLAGKIVFMVIATALLSIHMLWFVPKTEAKASLLASLPTEHSLTPVFSLLPIAPKSENIVFELSNAHAVNILIETEGDFVSPQPGYTFDQFCGIRFTQSAITVGLPSSLFKIKSLSDVGRQLVNSLQKKGGAVVWEAARLKKDGELVLDTEIFGYMDKDGYHSGLMRLNFNSLQYIIIDVSTVQHETIHGHQQADLETIMAHEAVHAVLPNRHVLREYEQGRALNELFTVYYTNQIRLECGMPLRMCYGDSLTQPFDDVVRQGLQTGKITPLDLVGDLKYRLNGLAVNSLQEPNSLDQYGLSQNLLALFEEHGLLEKK